MKPFNKACKFNLIACEAYAWGKSTDLTVLTAQCRYIRPMTVDTTIAAGSLEGAIRAFVQNWEFAAPGPENRRIYGDSLATAILSQVRTPWVRIHLPLVLR